MRLRGIGLLVGLAVTTPAFAGPHVLELFTSESCSSCPPADRLLGELATERSDVLALAFHVDYWDQLGWRDRFSSPDATARQRAYAERLGTEVYTPELVIDGQATAVGSDRQAVLTALQRPAPGVALGATVAAGRVAIEVGSGRGRAAIVLVGYDPRRETAVGGGENGGRKLVEFNVVRSFAVVGHWSGRPLQLQAAAGPGERQAVLLQSADGAILASTR